MDLWFPSVGAINQYLLTMLPAKLCANCVGTDPESNGAVFYPMGENHLIHGKSVPVNYSFPISLFLQSMI